VKLSLSQETIPALQLLPLVVARLETQAGRAAFEFSARRKNWMTQNGNALEFMLQSIWDNLPSPLPETERIAIEQGLLRALDFAERAQRRKMFRRWTWTQFRCFALKGAEEARQDLLNWNSDNDEDWENWDWDNEAGEAA
jgi:hypothetical protein